MEALFGADFCRKPFSAETQQIVEHVNISILSSNVDVDPTFSPYPAKQVGIYEIWFHIRHASVQAICEIFHYRNYVVCMSAARTFKNLYRETRCKSKRESLNRK